MQDQYPRPCADLPRRRFVQGLAAASLWSGALTWLINSFPAARRGAVIGTALGVAISGALIGPAIGALAGGLLLFAAGCGQKGPLVLPDDTAEPPARTPAGTPAAPPAGTPSPAQGNAAAVPAEDNDDGEDSDDR